MFTVIQSGMWWKVPKKLFLFTFVGDKYIYFTLVGDCFCLLFFCEFFSLLLLKSIVLLAFQHWPQFTCIVSNHEVFHLVVILLILSFMMRVVMMLMRMMVRILMLSVNKWKEPNKGNLIRFRFIKFKWWRKCQMMIMTRMLVRILMLSVNKCKGPKKGNLIRFSFIKFKWWRRWW